MEWGTLRIGGGGFVSGIVTGKTSMYARTDVGGAYRYDYEKKQWVQLMDFVNDTDRGFLSVDAMCVDPVDDKIAYFLCGCAYFSSERTSIFKTTDGGETWSPSRPLRDAEGRPIRHPRAPCPMYDMEGPEAASGCYCALFTGTYDPELQQFFGRGPLYLYHGAFDAAGEQPVRFTKGRLLLTRGPDDRYGNSCYSSFTVRGGERVLWYPDAKYNLLGIRIAEREESHP